MKRQFLAPILIGLLGLTVACSKSEPGTGASKELRPLKDLAHPLEPIPPLPTLDRGAPSASDQLANMTCKVDFGTSTMMRAFDEEIADQTAKYSETHPRVVAMKESLEKMRAAELANCAKRAERLSQPKE